MTKRNSHLECQLRIFSRKRSMVIGFWDEIFNTFSHTAMLVTRDICFARNRVAKLLFLPFGDMRELLFSPLLLLPDPNRVGRVSFVAECHQSRRNGWNSLFRSNPARDRHSMLSDLLLIWRWSRRDALREEHPCPTSVEDVLVRSPFELTDWWTIPTSVVPVSPK